MCSSPGAMCCIMQSKYLACLSADVLWLHRQVEVGASCREVLLHAHLQTTSAGVCSAPGGMCSIMQSAYLAGLSSAVQWLHREVGGGRLLCGPASCPPPGDLCRCFCLSRFGYWVAVERPGWRIGVVWIRMWCGHSGRGQQGHFSGQIQERAWLYAKSTSSKGRCCEFQS